MTGSQSHGKEENTIFVILVLYVTLLMLIAKQLKRETTGRQIFVILAFVAVGILICFRDLRVGADTGTYYRMYISLGTNIATKEDLELGFVWLVKLLYKISAEPQTLFITQGILVAVSCSYFINKNTETVIEAYIAVLAFLAFNLFSFHLSGVRQSFAMSICLFAYGYIKRHKFWRFLLLTGLASLFHSSAIFFVLAYWIANTSEMRARIWSMVGSIASILFLEWFMAMFSLFNDRFSKYGVEATDNGYIFFAVVTIITVFDLVYRTAIVQNTALDTAHCRLNYINVGMWIMRLFTRVIERISFFFLPSTMIVLAHTPGAFTTSKNKRIYTAILSLLLIILFLYRMKNWTYGFCQF